MPHDFATVAQHIRARGRVTRGRSKFFDLFETHLTYVNRQPMILVGDTGVGKTMFLNECLARLPHISDIRASESKFTGIMIGPNAISSLADFERNLWDGIIYSTKQKYTKLPDELELPFVPGTNPRFLYQLHRYWSYFPNDIFVAFFDDFQDIFRYNTSAEYRSIIGVMNDICRDDLPSNIMGYLTFFLSLNHVLPKFQDASPFAVEELRFLPLDPSSFRELCHDLVGGSDIIPLNCLDWIYRYTQGHPLFGSILLPCLFDVMAEDARTEFVSLQELPEVTHKAMTALRSNTRLESWFSALFEEEQYVLLKLAADEGLIPNTFFTPSANSEKKKPTFKTTCEHLKERGYLTKTTEGYELAMQFVYDWLNLWSRFDEKLSDFMITSKVSPVPQPLDILDTGITIDLAAQKVYVDGKQIPGMIPTAYDALICLARNAGKVVAKEMLGRAIRHEQYYEGDDNLITTTISRVRDALGEKGPRYLITRHKKGYSLECPVKFLNDTVSQPA